MAPLPTGGPGALHLVPMPLVPVGAAIEILPTTQDVTRQDLAEGVPEVLDAVRVDDGVDGRVGVRQEDGHVHQDLRAMQFGEEQFQAVEHVHGQPAQGKQPHDDGERLGRADLPLKQGAVVLVAVAVAHALELDLAHLLAGHGEDLQVDAQHDEQRQQHTHKEVKVDHVVHVHHALKEALQLAAAQQAAAAATRGGACPGVVAGGGRVTGLLLLVPFQEGDEADHEGQDP